jgi:hypothetical protein
LAFGEPLSRLQCAMQVLRILVACWRHTRLTSHISLARTLWLRGFPDQARRTAKTAIDEAANLGDPLSIGISLAYCSPVFLWSGDFRTANDYATFAEAAKDPADQAMADFMLGNTLHRRPSCSAILL